MYFFILFNWPTFFISKTCKLYTEKKEKEKKNRIFNEVELLMKTLKV